MKNTRQGKINFLQPDWADGQSVQAGFTTRNGGVSRPPFNSLNFGPESGDPQHNVEANRTAMARAFSLPPHLLLTVRQVHGTDILILDEANPDLDHFQKVECDAIITNQTGIMVGILVADCYPIILFDPRNRIAGVVHAGWRGAAAGLIGETVKAMCTHFQSQPEDLFAAIGPGIGVHKYVVDRPVRDAFRNGSGNWERIADEISLGQWKLDLQLSCRLQLETAGLKVARITQVDECTCCHRELFFSYRRDQGETGRQLGFILLPEHGSHP
jgi:YfiH family protein